MFVCLCHGVSDKKIKALIESGTKSIKELQDQCKAGANCGACLFQVKEIFDETIQSSSSDACWKKAGNE